MTGWGLSGQGKLERIESEQGVGKKEQDVISRAGDRQTRTGLAGAKADKKGQDLVGWSGIEQVSGDRA